MSDKIPLAFLTRELMLLTDQHPPKNRKLWEMIVDGDLPAEQESGRWFVNRDDLPAIVEILRRSATERPASKHIRNAASGVA